MVVVIFGQIVDEFGSVTIQPGLAGGKDNRNMGCEPAAPKTVSLCH